MLGGSDEMETKFDRQDCRQRRCARPAGAVHAALDFRAGLRGPDNGGAALLLAIQSQG